MALHCSRGATLNLSPSGNLVGTDIHLRTALEEHFVIDEPAHVDRWLTLVLTVSKDIISRIKGPLCDLGEARIAAMAEPHIDFAVLSNFGTLDAATAMTFARRANDHLAKAVQVHPDHFAGFSTVPLQDPKAGAEEFERAVRDLGMKGAMVIGQTDGLYLDDDRFSPLWERAEALDAPLYLHAADAAVMPATYAGRPELEGATWSWTAETAAHALRIIFGGVFDRFPKAKLLLGRMGEIDISWSHTNGRTLTDATCSQCRLAGVDSGPSPITT